MTPIKSPIRLLREGNPAAVGALLLAFVVLTFFPCLDHGFVNFDDDVYVYDNARVLHGLTWENTRWAFTTLDAGFWHPLTWMSLLLDRQLYGLNGGGYHLTSLLLHAANTLLLFALFRRLTGATWRSAFVAALFAVHPLHVEPVAWVASRKDVLSTLFWMLTLLMYVRYAREAEDGIQRSEVRGQKSDVGGPRAGAHLPASIFYLLSLCSFVCGLMSKTMVVTLPFILLLLDWWPLQRLRLKRQDVRIRRLLPLLLEKLPFFAAAFVCGLITIHAEKAVGAIQLVSDIPFLHRLSNATLGYGRYLLEMVWPGRLAVFYPYPRTWTLWPVAATGLLLLLTSGLILRAGRRWPYLAFGWIWYCLTLLPVAGLIQVGSHSHADRYTYVPLIGVFVILAWGACDLSKRWPRQAAILSAAAATVLLLLLPLTRRQMGYWKDSESLFRHALAVTANNYFAHNNFGLALLQKGQVDEAIIHFNKALEADPSQSKPHNNLGIALLDKGRMDESIAQFRAALESRPDFAEVCYNLGVALLRKGQPQEAIAPFQKAVESSPDLAKARYGLGSALVRTGRTGEAVAQFRKALELDPDYAEAHNDLGLALFREGKLDEARAHFEQALKIRPDTAETCYNLGLVLVRKGRVQEAIPRLQKAVVLQADLTEAHVELANALLRAGRVDEAIVELQKVVQANPNLASAQSDLASALLRKGRPAEARAHYQAAVDAQPGNVFLLNNLAWVLATCPQASVRDGTRALELAREAERLSGSRNASILETLAAAYAEIGRFPEAMAAAERALELASAQTNRAQAEPLQDQLGHYRAGSPFRDRSQTNMALEPSHPAANKP